ncbi:hypothetical protein BH11ACT4_BH11ACT4_07630 [soil metagenome]
MKQITYDGSRWLVGDEATAALLDLAVELARHNLADSVTLSAFTLDGRPEQLTLLIGPATMMTAESIAVQFAEPDNAATVTDVRDRITRLTPGPATPAAITVEQSHLDDF